MSSAGKAGISPHCHGSAGSYSSIAIVISLTIPYPGSKDGFLLSQGRKKSFVYILLAAARDRKKILSGKAMVSFAV